MGSWREITKIQYQGYMTLGDEVTVQGGMGLSFKEANRRYYVLETGDGLAYKLCTYRSEKQFMKSKKGDSPISSLLFTGRVIVNRLSLSTSDGTQLGSVFVVIHAGRPSYFKVDDRRVRREWIHELRKLAKQSEMKSVELRNTTEDTQSTHSIGEMAPPPIPAQPQKREVPRGRHEEASTPRQMHPIRHRAAVQPRRTPPAPMSIRDTPHQLPTNADVTLFTRVHPRRQSPSDGVASVIGRDGAIDGHDSPISHWHDEDDDSSTDDDVEDDDRHEDGRVLEIHLEGEMGVDGIYEDVAPARSAPGGQCNVTAGSNSTAYGNHIFKSASQRTPIQAMEHHVNTRQLSRFHTESGRGRNMTQTHCSSAHHDRHSAENVPSAALCDGRSEQASSVYEPMAFSSNGTTVSSPRSMVASRAESNPAVGGLSERGSWSRASSEGVSDCMNHSYDLFQNNPSGHTDVNEPTIHSLSKALSREQSVGSVSVIVNKDDIEGVIFVDWESRVWVATWKKDIGSKIQHKLHVGDQVIGVNSQEVRNVTQLRYFTSTSAYNMVKLVISRLPLANIVYAQKKLSQSWGCEFVHNVLMRLYPGALTEAGLSKLTRGPTGIETGWVATECFHQPVAMLNCGRDEIKHRLLQTGTEFSVVLHPKDFIDVIIRHLKKLLRRNQSDYEY